MDYQMVTPLVSVIVPIYNVEQYLGRCIDSILKQKYEKLEIILVDDGSPDNCGTICDSYALADNRIKVIHKNNGGLSSARNAGIEVSTGNYIGFIDSDDWIEPDMYDVLVRNILQEDADVSDVNMKSVVNEAPFLNQNETIKVFRNNDILVDYFLSDRSSVCRKLYSRKVIGDIRFPEGKTNEDICTNYKFLTRANKLVKSSLYMYHYFNNPKSITGERFRERDFDLIEACDELYDLAKNNEEIIYYATVKKALSRYSLLGRYISYENDTISDLEGRINQLFKELQRNWPLLIKSYISVKRKVLCTIICIIGPFRMKKLVSISRRRK